jgi:hypothetical protein
MSNLYSQPITYDDDGSNRLRVYRNIATNETIGSPNGNVRRGPSGIVFDAQPDYYGAGTVECGNFDTASHFKIGDMVRLAEDTDFYGSGSTPAGMYLCVSPVPGLYDNNQRLSGIKYAPISPEPDTLAHEVTDLATQGRYWQAFGVP